MTRARARGALARSRAQPVRRHPALLALVHRGDARVMRGALRPTSKARCSPLTSTRTSRRSLPSASLFEDCDDYLTSYPRHGLVGRRSVFAHNVHATHGELELLAEHGRQRRALSDEQLRAGQRPVPASRARGARRAGRPRLRRRRPDWVLAAQGGSAGVLHAAAARRPGLPLTSAHLLHLATAAGAEALGMSEEVGMFSVGKQFDALWLRPAPGTTLAVGLRHASGPEEALARTFALGTSADIEAVYVGGEPLASPSHGAGQVLGAPDSGAGGASVQLRAEVRPRPWFAVRRRPTSRCPPRPR